MSRPSSLAFLGDAEEADGIEGAEHRHGADANVAVQTIRLPTHCALKTFMPPP